ncbi:MAG: NAD(P)/FAD-dependent oxidoreductase [Chloroflexi bacterium]|nr:NAD(P)/FAD-dependent oxidoreductase [Chloroflexota bacterium]
MTANRIIVVGAGAGGMMAAGRAAELGAAVVVLERTGRPGNKILISGKTRCNLTNTKELDDFIAMYGPNGRFLYGAFHRYFRDDLLAFLRRYGVETKSEAGGRVFPVSDDARDVSNALERYMADHGVQLLTGARATGIQAVNGRVTGVQTDKGVFPATAVVLATGGESYPETGSTGDGYRLAAALGHTIIKVRPALVPLRVSEVQRARSMQGASLRNVRLTAYQRPADEIDPLLAPTADCGRGMNDRQPSWPIIESRMGDMMVAHFGIGGPVALLMSLAIVDALENGPVSVSIDLKPGLDERQLRQQLQQDFDRYGKRSYKNILGGLLPPKMVDPFVEMTAIPPGKPGHEINAEERERLLRCLKSLRFNIEGALSMASAMVTAGGISLKEIDPRNMASRLVEGLYFCGEVMDLDGDTGGYNLQAAFSTGYVAGESAAHT